MTDTDLIRMEFIKACAYYEIFTGTPIKCEITQDLTDLITERFQNANLTLAIGNSRRYQKMLDDAFQEELPNIGDKMLDNKSIHRCNFRSLVAKVVSDKELLVGPSQKLIADKNANEVCHSPSAKPSAAPHDCLMGFTVHIKPDAHLDEMIPICARDQHLLFNIFGDQWKSPMIISAYTAVKGQTGFMHKWSSSNLDSDNKRG